MEPYKSYGNGRCGRSNNPCGQNSRSYSSNSCNVSRNPYQQKPNMSCNLAIDNIMAGNSDTGCKDNNYHMEHMPVAMAYVPVQEWCDLYDHETAICQGTAFPELNLIFCGSRGKM